MSAVDGLESAEVSLLVRLAREEPMNMRAFAVACRVSPATARQVHARLEALGLIETDYVEQGATRIASVKLTKGGREVAAALQKVEQAMQAHLRRKGRGS